MARVQGPGGSSNAPGRQFLGVQYLRAVAAFMVAYLHLAIQIPAYTGQFERSLGGNLNLGNGVDIFFVISGFIMMVSTRASMRPAAFFARRVIRIVPLYWSITLLVVAIALVQPAWFRTTVVAPEYVFRSLFFIPYANPGQGGSAMPILVPGWSLNFEMAFYVVFALSLLLPARARVAAVGLVFAAGFVLARLAPSQPGGVAWGFYGDLRVAEFWLGMVIGAQAGSTLGRTTPAAALWGLIALSMALLMAPVRLYAAFTPDIATLCGSVVPAAVLVWAVVSLELQGRVLHHGALLTLGNASYSIYLSHILTLGVVRLVWVKAGLDAPDLLHVAIFAVVSMLAVAAAGVLVYRVAEQPMLAGMRRLLRI